MTISNQQLELFQSLFKGREDIHARRWENDDRDGYMPAYNVDWDGYEKHKALGGTFQNFKHKEPAPFTPAIIITYLLCKETVCNLFSAIFSAGKHLKISILSGKEK